MERTIIILSGGGPSPDAIPAADFVIAADSGVALATGLGLHVDLIVGDLDSVSPDDLAAARERGTEIESHPVDKDATDLDLAMSAAQRRGADRIIVLGGGSGRLDHLLGVATLLASPRWSDCNVEWWTPATTAYPVSGIRRIETAAGDLVSLIALGGDAVVSLAGTRWPLEHVTLPFGSTIGISNEATGPEVAIEVHQGSAVLFHSRAES